MNSEIKPHLLAVAHDLSESARLQGDRGQWFNDGVLDIAKKIEGYAIGGHKVSREVDESFGRMFAEGQRHALDVLDRSTAPEGHGPMDDETYFALWRKCRGGGQDNREELERMRAENDRRLACGLSNKPPEVVAANREKKAQAKNRRENLVASSDVIARLNLELRNSGNALAVLVQEFMPHVNTYDPLYQRATEALKVWRESTKKQRFIDPGTGEACPAKGKVRED